MKCFLRIIGLSLILMLCSAWAIAQDSSEHITPDQQDSMKKVSRLITTTVVADAFDLTGDGFVIAAAGEMYTLLTDPEVDTIEEVNLLVETMGKYLVVALASKFVAVLLKIPAKIRLAVLVKP